MSLDAQAAEGEVVGLDVPPAQIAVRGRGPYQFEPLGQVQVNKEEMEDEEEEIDY